LITFVDASTNWQSTRSTTQRTLSTSQTSLRSLPCIRFVEKGAKSLSPLASETLEYVPLLPSLQIESRCWHVLSCTESGRVEFAGWSSRFSLFDFTIRLFHGDVMYRFTRRRRHGWQISFYRIVSSCSSASSTQCHSLTHDFVLQFPRNALYRSEDLPSRSPSFDRVYRCTPEGATEPYWIRSRKSSPFVQWVHASCCLDSRTRILNTATDYQQPQPLLRQISAASPNHHSSGVPHRSITHRSIASLEKSPLVFAFSICRSSHSAFYHSPVVSHCRIFTTSSLFVAQNTS